MLRDREILCRACYDERAGHIFFFNLDTNTANTSGIRMSMSMVIRSVTVSDQVYTQVVRTSSTYNTETDCNRRDRVKRES